jgi:hypothetical protein
MARKQNEHYVNNKDFSLAVVEYCHAVQEAKEKNLPKPIVTDYIAQCFLKISEGVSHKSNFVRYTYREEMVMDGVENCLRAIENYNIDTATRTGNPNAFAYFTQIIWYAFLRRIAKEKRQQDVRLRFIAQSGFEEFLTTGEHDESGDQVRALVDDLYDKINKVRTMDEAIKDFGKQEKTEKVIKSSDSDLSIFFEQDEL